MPPSSRQLVADRQHLPVGSFWVCLPETGPRLARNQIVDHSKQTAYL